MLWQHKKSFQSFRKKKIVLNQRTTWHFSRGSKIIQECNRDDFTSMLRNCFLIIRTPVYNTQLIIIKLFAYKIIKTFLSRHVILITHNFFNHLVSQVNWTQANEKDVNKNKIIIKISLWRKET